ncbi:hypothetical protein Q9966_013824 [Columba livia]|nr:hypothetical protein Q9966_013824 [Columba livia]
MEPKESEVDTEVQAAEQDRQRAAGAQQAAGQGVRFLCLARSKTTVTALHNWLRHPGPLLSRRRHDLLPLRRPPV